MMPYIQIYDIIEDMWFQSEISEETKRKALENPRCKAEFSDTPFPNLPIMSRFRSQWPATIVL